MSKDPLDRYQSASEFRNALADALRQINSALHVQPLDESAYNQKSDKTLEEINLKTDFQDYLDSNLDDEFQDFDSLPPLSQPEIAIGSIFNQTKQPLVSSPVSSSPAPSSLVPPISSSLNSPQVPATKEFTSLLTPTVSFESETNFQLKFKSSDDSAVEVPALDPALLDDDSPQTLSIKKVNSGRSGHYKRLPIKRK
jgi:hypothetical protein